MFPYLTFWYTSKCMSIFIRLAHSSIVSYERRLYFVLAICRSNWYIIRRTGCCLTRNKLLAKRLNDRFLRSRFFRSEEHTSELQSRFDLVCRLLLEKLKFK